jgi:hypothetical protein
MSIIHSHTFFFPTGKWSFVGMLDAPPYMENELACQLNFDRKKMGAVAA